MGMLLTLPVIFVGIAVLVWARRTGAARALTSK
jgi:hypothetical protein